MEENLHSEPTQAQPSVAPKLEVTKGEYIGKTFQVQMKTRIGRELDNDIVLVDPKISRYHAEITLEAGQWVLTDLGSSNRTFINDTPIDQPTNLRTEDRIGLGELELTIHIPTTHHEATLPVTPTRVGRAAPVTAGSPTPQPAPAGGPSRLVWLAGGFVILLCVAALVAIFFVSRLAPGSDDEPGAAPTGDVAESADVDNADQGDGTTDSVPSSENLVLIYEDDFSDSFGGWDDAFDAFTTKQYGNNRYQIEVSTSNLIAWGLANRDVADFELEVEARREDGALENSYGLLFRVQDRENFYRFDISSDGFYLVSKFVDGQWETLVDWTASPIINEESNLLKVSAFGPEITVSVNDQMLTSVTDDSLDHGNFGFFASAFNEPYIWVSYDNLKLWAPEGQELTLIPTATRPTLSLADAPTPTLPVVAEAQQSSTPTTSADTEVAAEEESEEASAEVEALAETEEATSEPTTEAEPTPTPVPLPEYASRSQILARGEQAVSGRIIFPVFDPEREIYDIYMADAADGDNLELVQENASQPALNEDGTEVAYRSWQPDNRGLFARPLAGEDAWRFDQFFESARPQFSPIDGSLMYHSRTGGPEPAVYRVIDGVGAVMRRDGAPIQGDSPKWSPDGELFVYNSCIGGKCGIMRSNIDGANPTLLTDDPSDTNPEISPDGSTIIFMSRRSGDWEIYRVDINGENLTALTSDDASDGLPTWSPDGQKIAFTANRDGKWAMWDMDPDGSNQRRLFLIDGLVDGIVAHDRANSRGWVEENIDWQP